MADDRPRAARSGKQINLAQLGQEVGAALCSSDSEIVVADPTSKVTQAQLAAALLAHTADPTFGQDEQSRQFAGLRAKAAAVWAGTDTFTAAQLQKIVAGLVAKAAK